ncbi:P2X purinoceptor 7-like [Dermacentor variabilis]|uniref:P2X purinoceptor 7-like n=1 Tax=Dermacentor variabilis TaxID=34621 RepID=UPI003F5C3B1B
MQSSSESDSMSGDYDSDLDERPTERPRTIKAYAYDPSASLSETDDESPQQSPSAVPRESGPATWCCCGDRCADMPTAREKTCCKEQDRVAKATEHYECITKHPLFDLYCLNEHVLELEYIKLQYYNPYRVGQRDQHDKYRYTAYRQFVWWIHGRLGQGRRVVIPSYVVHRLREEFPSRSGQYTGYLDP